MRVRAALGAAAIALAVAFASPGPAGADLPPPQRDPVAVRTAIRRVLDRPEYRPARPSTLERILSDIGSWLDGLVGRAHNSWVGPAVLLAVLALIGLAVARWARGITVDPGAGVAVARIRRRTGADWRAAADVHEAAGEWRDALRCRYRALVADLADRGVVEEVPGRTSGEYRAEVGSGAPRGAADFAGATELFELAWYGNRTTGADEAGRFRGLADRVLAEVGG